MSVVGLLGGLGNQLFQVALGIVVEERLGRPVEYDLSAYRTTPAYLGVQQIGLRLPVRHGPEVLPHPSGRLPRIAVGARRLLGPGAVRLEQPSTDLARILAAAGTPAWYYGYWQLPRLVEQALPRLRTDLGLAGPPAARRIGVHVRRGDMLAVEQALAPEAYRDAVAALRREEDLPVEVFSDDIAWCRRWLGIDGATYRERGTAGADLLALADSAALVCSPSTFSWWAATLRERDPATVVAPAAFPGPRDLRDPAWRR